MPPLCPLLVAAYWRSSYSISPPDMTVTRWPAATSVIAIALMASLNGCSSNAKPSNSPSPGETLQALQSRPLKWQHGDVACQVSPITKKRGDKAWPYGDARGSGPIYAAVPDAMGTKTPNKVLWISAPEYRGAVLIRGGRLGGPGQLLLASSSGPSIRGVGNATEMTVASGRLSFYEGLYISPSSSSQYRDWPSYTYVTDPGCYAWQVDGERFTEVIILTAT
jgi:hypothetical protein